MAAKTNNRNAAFQAAVQRRLQNKSGVKKFPAPRGGVKKFPFPAKKQKAPGGIVTKAAGPVQAMPSGRLTAKPAAPGTPAQPSGLAGAAQRKLQMRRRGPVAAAPSAKKKTAIRK